MKKFTAIVLALIISLSFTGMFAFAADSSVTVFVTISDGAGKLVLTQKAVSVTDTDNDGALTVKDALYCAHQQNYSGGAAGFKTSYNSKYKSWQIDMLWGDDTNGLCAFGYYVNNKWSSGLLNSVAANDSVKAYVYTDLKNWSDSFSYFSEESETIDANRSVTLTLYAMSYDENWNVVAKPVTGAAVTLNGGGTSYTTDKNGQVIVTFEDSGSFVVSAVSGGSGLTLVPPVCTVTVRTSWQTFVLNLTTFFQKIVNFFKTLFSK